MRSFRATGGGASSSTAYGNPQNVAQDVTHAANAASNHPDPRRNLVPLDDAPIDQPATRRKWRASRYMGGDRVIPREEGTGIAQEPANGYAVGVGNGYGPSGSPTESNEPATHFNTTGAPPQQGEPNVRASGGWDGAWLNPVDVATMRGGGDQIDPRRLRQTQGAPAPRYEPGSYTTIDQFLVPNTPDAPGWPDQKPQVWFHEGRPTRRHVQFFLRGFNQIADYQNNGRKLRIGPPPTFGNVVATDGNRASFPIQTTVEGEDVVTGTGYHGARYGAPGMSTYSGPRKNTFRAMPQPWDTFIVDTGGGVQ